MEIGESQASTSEELRDVPIGQAANAGKLPTSGTKNRGKPYAHEGGGNGGVWKMSPRFFQKGANR